ncbi:hypothetical protein EDB85DRAFT_1895660 [Lactarius pseudohatsudake]|nr:hypothetical protein EDB85DRAFT_1895660 [Lactarius pseudohatsudake]
MKTVLLKKMCDVWRWKLTLFDVPPTTHATLCQVATPSFHLHHARPSRSSRIVPCVARALALLLAEWKIDLKGMRNDEPGSATNRGLEVCANKQNVNNRGQTTCFKDAIHLQFYNAYQESVMKELEQWQKAEGKQCADTEEDLRRSELLEQSHNAVNLVRSVVAKDAMDKVACSTWAETGWKMEKWRADRGMSMCRFARTQRLGTGRTACSCFA